MKKWSHLVCEKAMPILEKINAHPFINELIDGTLDAKNFGFYIQQDTLYLGTYGRILSDIAKQLDNPEYSSTFFSFADDSVYVEQSMHDVYKDILELSDSEVKSPTCTLYTSYLDSCFYTKPLAVAVSSVLPCFWIYLKVGEYIVANRNDDENPYQQWIDTYSGDEFEKMVDKAFAIADDLASKCDEKTIEEMTNAFILTSKMEYMFWDSAYKLEQWIS